MKKSIVAWNSPRTKLSGITIPQNPIRLNCSAEKTTWDDVERVKKMVNMDSCRFFRVYYRFTSVILNFL